MLLTFTPIDGYTEVIKEYLDGATSVESREAELLGGELVPYVQRIQEAQRISPLLPLPRQPFRWLRAH
jgi:hypothetical protein